ncbi:MAG: pantoate--beta-alanine ligase [Candidatus Omnitrophica bacterium]|nr:pantoate--beta-alanine ligase [Candidatus Omnitrophota bacterium]
MTIIRSVRQMQQRAVRLRAQGKRIGVVPTMGALHEGHLSLIRRAARENDVVVVTMFVNPLQFGPKEDFASYPRPFARDVRLAASAGAHVIFSPAAQDMYPEGSHTTIDPGPLAQRWEGKIRPGHFRGVATVVWLLFEITQPTNAYFGQKDYQQARIIHQMIRDAHLPIRFHLCPTIREADGLAMSSRNIYLSPSHRRQAAVLRQALQQAQRGIRAGERRAEGVQRAMTQRIRSAPEARIDYVALVNAATLEPLTRVSGRVALLLAVRFGRTRLIDNLLVDVP